MQVIKNILFDFYLFLKCPDDNKINLSFKDKLVFVFILLSFELIITALFIIPIEYGVELILNARFDKINYYETLEIIIFFYILIIPFIEELAFRYFLIYRGFKTKFIRVDKWRKIFGVLVYTSASLFALAHISNYDNNEFLFYVLKI